MNKYFTLAVSLLVLFSCNFSEKKRSEEVSRVSDQTTKKKFQSILDSAQVQGLILFYDKNRDTFYSNDKTLADIGQIPASTFKIPHSIIALETGIINNDSTIIKWQGNSRAMEIWEQDLTFGEAFQYSCVPCYKKVASWIGTKRMIEGVSDLDYGSMDIHSDNIDKFWLTGKSRITAYEQIDFLRRFDNGELPIRKRTEEIMRRMMVIDKSPAYTLSGKSGLSENNDIYNGWYVGFIETQGNKFYFATNIETSAESSFSEFANKRKAVTLQAFELLNVI